MPVSFSYFLSFHQLPDLLRKKLHIPDQAVKCPISVKPDKEDADRYSDDHSRNTAELEANDQAERITLLSGKELHHCPADQSRSCTEHRQEIQDRDRDSKKNSIWYSEE